MLSSCNLKHVEIKMIVADYMNVLGRGWVLIVQGKELQTMEIHCGEKIVKGDTTFTIKGVERTMYFEGMYNRLAGLILDPNNKVPDYFEVNDEIKIEKVCSYETKSISSKLCR